MERTKDEEALVGKHAQRTIDELKEIDHFCVYTVADNLWKLYDEIMTLKIAGVTVKKEAK